jgi:WD repeat-containing protein 45
MFKNEIKSVKLRKNSVVVVLESKIYVYNLRDLRLKDTFKTFRNPKGLCCLTTDANQEVIAFPYEDRGKVLIKFYNDDLTSCIDAHENTIACMALNPDGSLLATASDKGTLVRIFNTATQDQVKELRRGIDRAEIYCLCFHFTSQWIACSSNTGTVHVYSIMSSVPNPDLGLGIFKKVLPKYFDSQWSYSQFRVRDSKTICTFLMDRPVLVVVTDDAMHHEINFLDPGHCTEGTVTNLLELDIV